MRWLLALLLLAAWPPAAVALDDLADEVQQVLREAHAEQQALEATLAALATEEGWRAAFRAFNARRDAQQERIIELYQHMKSRAIPEQWEALPRVLAADDGTAQELLGFLQTYDAGRADFQPILQQLRAEAAAGQEQAIRQRFP
jgi:hypothetical protein